MVNYADADVWGEILENLINPEENCKIRGRIVPPKSNFWGNSWKPDKTCRK